MATGEAPETGFPVKSEEWDDIYQSLERRMELFPDEGLYQSFMVVMLNAGEQYTPVTCLMGEWTGVKGDILGSFETPDVPLCPNGHTLTEGFGIALGWVHDSSTLSVLMSNVTDVLGDETQEFPPPAPLLEEET